MAERITLATMDGETMEVDKEIAMKSVLIRGIVEDSGVEDDVPLPSIKKPILEKVIEYLEHIHTNSPPRIRSESSYTISDWHAQFVKVEDLSQLHDLIDAA